MRSTPSLSQRRRSWLALSLTGLMVVTLTACTKTPEAEPMVVAPAPTTTVGTDIDDSLITTKVKTALMADDDVKSFDIQTETRKGEVQLSGFVDNAAQIDRALTLARAVEGVTSVSNLMSVKK